MSFNPQHISISRSNYEEYFLLYVDGELTAEEKQEVDFFAAANPDLQEELHLLLSTKLGSEALPFPDKTSLLAEGMKINAIDESLLLYIDNELDGKKKKEVEERKAKDANYRLQYELLAKTKLDNNELIPYPDKKELYRSLFPAVRPLFFVRIAAAVLLVAALGIVWQAINNQPQPVPLAVTNHQAPKTTVPPNKIIAQPLSGVPNETGVSKEEKGEKASTAIASFPAQKKKVPRLMKQVKTSLPEKTREEAMAYSPVHKKEGIAINQPANAFPAPQQTINNQPVTTTAAVTYTNTEAAADNAMVSQAVALTKEDKKGSVRGFLRKATRFIERRTGIDPVNEDDELLIGALAIKLK